MSLPALSREKTSRSISSLSVPSSSLDLLLFCLFSLFLSLFRFNFPLYSFISWSYIYFLLFFFLCLSFFKPPLLYFLYQLLHPSSQVSFFYIFALFSTALLLPIPPSLLPSRQLLLSKLGVFFLFTVHLLTALFVYSLFVYSSFFAVYLFTVCLQFIHSRSHYKG